MPGSEEQRGRVELCLGAYAGGRSHARDAQEILHGTGRVARRLPRFGLPVDRRGPTFDDLRNLRIAGRQSCGDLTVSPFGVAISGRIELRVRKYGPGDELLVRVDTGPELEHALCDRFGALTIARVEEHLAGARQYARRFRIVRERIGEP